MSMNRANILVDSIVHLLDGKLDEDTDIKLFELINELHDLADPQADRLRWAEREADRLRKELDSKDSAYSNHVIDMDKKLYLIEQERDQLKAVIARCHEAMCAVSQAAYDNAFPVCCGYAGAECCGLPDPDWSEHDKLIMDTLDGPINAAANQLRTEPAAAQGDEMSDDYYYSGQYAEEQAEAEVRARVCYPNRDANARLIAAAPELYEALDKIIEWYDNHHLRNEPAFQYYHSARAALAKASEG